MARFPPADVTREALLVPDAALVRRDPLELEDLSPALSAAAAGVVDVIDAQL